MGSTDLAGTMLLLPLLLPVVLLVAAQAQDTPADTVAAAATGEVTPNTVTSDKDQARRERLRNFFARRRDQRVKPGDERKGEGQEDSKTAENRRVRPQAINIRKQNPEIPDAGEERIETSVSVSSSVSTSSKITKRIRPETESTNKKPDETTSEATERTTRKRFRIIKNQKGIQDELLKKLLANIDQKNEIGIEQKQIRRPSRFRPSLRRDQIRKKAESALKPKSQNSRIRIRKPNRTTEKTIETTTVQAKDHEVEVATEESIIDQLTTVVTEGNAGVTETAREDVFNDGQDKEIINEITTERHSIPIRNPVNAFEPHIKGDRNNFFRRNSPRRFGFDPKPVIITSDSEIETIDDEASTFNNLPKEENFKFVSFPVLNRVTPKAKAIQKAQTLPTILPQPHSKDIELDNRRNQISQNQNTFASSNSIVQPAFLRPTKFKPLSQIIIPETQRNINPPRPNNQPNRIQPQSNIPPTITVKSAPTTKPVFPTFEIPDFFNVPFASFQPETPLTHAQEAPPGQNNAGIAQPHGRVQGHPRAKNLNIITGSFSVGW